ncbi:MAG: GIY-YIG nuclease family protein [Bacteroidota bacterium]
MHYVYLLYSIRFERFYVGYTSNIQERIKQHNVSKVKSTKAFVPWTMVYFEKFEIMEGALKREKYFKTAAGRRGTQRN